MSLQSARLRKWEIDVLEVPQGAQTADARVFLPLYREVGLVVYRLRPADGCYGRAVRLCDEPQTLDLLFSRVLTASDHSDSHCDHCLVV